MCLKGKVLAFKSQAVETISHSPFGCRQYRVPSNDLHPRSPHFLVSLQLIAGIGEQDRVAERDQPYPRASGKTRQIMHIGQGAHQKRVDVFAVQKRPELGQTLKIGKTG